MPINRRVPKKVKVTLTQAKILSEEDFGYLINRIRRTEHALRDEVLVRLTFNTGLRVKECAGLQWKKHVLDGRGRIMQKLWVSADIGKRSVEREIEISEPLREALTKLRASRPKDKFVIYPLATRRAVAPGEDAEQCGVNALTQYFIRLYEGFGLEGVTSHSGRRSLITNRALNAGRGSYSLRDVQRMVGHKSLETTQGYIDRAQDDADMVNGVFA